MPKNITMPRPHLCYHTQMPIGPDGLRAAPEYCGPGRRCYRFRAGPTCCLRSPKTNQNPEVLIMKAVPPSWLLSQAWPPRRRLTLGRLFARPEKSPATMSKPRTASVMAGPCHYNGELRHPGRDALLAWNFSGGHFQGVDLAGVRAVAAVNRRGQTSAKPSGAQDRTCRGHECQRGSGRRGCRACCAKSAALTGRDRQDFAAPPFRSPTRAKATTWTPPALPRCTWNTGPTIPAASSPNLVWYAPLSPIEHRMWALPDLAPILAHHFALVRAKAKTAPSTGCHWPSSSCGVADCWSAGSPDDVGLARLCGEAHGVTLPKKWQ